MYQLWMRTNNNEVIDGSHGHLVCDPGMYGRTYSKTCKSASLIGNLCNSVSRDDSRCIAPQKDGKYPLSVENM